MPDSLACATSLFPESKEPADPVTLTIGICEPDEVPGMMLVYEPSECDTNRRERCERKESKLRALRTLFTTLWSETLLTRKRRLGKHAAMIAKPASIIDQYRIVVTVTYGESADWLD